MSAARGKLTHIREKSDFWVKDNNQFSLVQISIIGQKLGQPIVKTSTNNILVNWMHKYGR
jgi:hypothetical protein